MYKLHAHKNFVLTLTCIAEAVTETGYLIFAIVATYSSLLISEFAFLDDYWVAVKGKDIAGHYIMSGRPIFALLGYSFRNVDSYNGFVFFRCLNILSIIAIFFAVRTILKQLTAESNLSNIAAFIFVLTPCMQIFSWWAICTPCLISIFISLLAINVITQKEGRYAVLLTGMLVIFSMLIYQPGALVYISVLPITAYKNRSIGFRKLINVLLPYFTAMGVGFFFLRSFGDSTGLRTTLTMSDISVKLIWYVKEALPRAVEFCLPIHYGSPDFWAVFIICLFFVLYGGYAVWKRNKFPGVFILVLGILFASAANLAVKENWASARSLTAPSLYFLFIAIIGIFHACEAAHMYIAKSIQIAFPLFALIGALMVPIILVTSVIYPQMNEAKFAKQRLTSKDININETIFVIPARYDSWSGATYYDEYGMASSSSISNITFFLRFIAKQSGLYPKDIVVIKSEETSKFPQQQVIDFYKGAAFY